MKNESTRLRPSASYLVRHSKSGSRLMRLLGPDLQLFRRRDTLCEHQTTQMLECVEVVCGFGNCPTLALHVRERAGDGQHFEHRGERRYKSRRRIEARTLDDVATG